MYIAVYFKKKTFHTLITCSGMTNIAIVNEQKYHLHDSYT